MHDAVPLGRVFLSVLLGLALAHGAYAAEEKPAVNSTVEMETVALPIVVDGHVVNYVFVNLRLELTPKADGVRVRAKEEYFRDDLVRVGHRTPFTRADDYNKVDDKRVIAEVWRFAAATLGPGIVKAVTITKEAAMKTLAPPMTSRPNGADIIP